MVRDNAQTDILNNISCALYHGRWSVKQGKVQLDNKPVQSDMAAELIVGREAQASHSSQSDSITYFELMSQLFNYNNSQEFKEAVVRHFVDKSWPQGTTIVEKDGKIDEILISVENLMQIETVDSFLSQTELQIEAEMQSRKRFYI